jgi:low affinity Fe/Cu permease
MEFTHEPAFTECSKLEELVRKRKSFEESIIGVENEQVSEIKTELNL